MNREESFVFTQINILNKQNPKKRYELLAQALASQPTDVITLQEVVYPEELAEVLATVGLVHSSYMPRFSDSDSLVNYLFIASKTELLKNTSVENSENVSHYATTVVEGRQLNLISSHLSWGSFAEPKRLQEVENIEKLATALEKATPGSTTLLGGDLNAIPQSRAVNFLKGNDVSLDGLTSTLWVDAHSSIGAPHNAITTDHAVNELGRETAMSIGIKNPSYIPKRQIDYIMSRGWIYGKTGTPLSFDYLSHPEGLTLSDHNGIQARILLN